MSEWRVRAAYDGMQDGIGVAIFKDDALCTSMTFEVREPGSIITPTMGEREGEAFLRAALNAAWEQGLRPDGFNDTRESMKATNAHLQDMRAIAFHKIGAAKP